MVEMNFHIDQNRLSFGLAGLLALFTLLLAYYTRFEPVHRIQCTYISPVKIFQFCITTGSVSKCILFLFRARGEDR